MRTIDYDTELAPDPLRDALGELTGRPGLFTLKWPNDVVGPDGRKAGGILVETAAEGDRLTDAVIGIGLNVNWAAAEMPAELASTATSLGEVAGRRIDRGALLAVLLEALDREIGAVEAGTSPLARYRAACRTLGTEVAVELGGRTVIGRAVDVDATGCLVVETSGGRETIASGEVVHVRPVVTA